MNLPHMESLQRLTETTGIGIRLSKAGNYRAPTCAYCHMYKGTHNAVENTVYAHMGVLEVDRGAEEYAAKRKKWIGICNDCHSSRFANCLFTWS